MYTQISPLIMSNMIQTRDEIYSTHELPIAESSNVFEVLFQNSYLNVHIYKVL